MINDNIQLIQTSFILLKFFLINHFILFNFEIFKFLHSLFFIFIIRFFNHINFRLYIFYKINALFYILMGQLVIKDINDIKKIKFNYPFLVFIKLFHINFLTSFFHGK